MAKIVLSRSLQELKILDIFCGNHFFCVKLREGLNHVEGSFPSILLGQETQRKLGTYQIADK
jgi:hypothetical protein